MLVTISPQILKLIMNLPYSAYLSDLSIEDAISNALKQPHIEVDLAASGYFLQDVPGSDAIYKAFEEYFESTVDRIKLFAGDPVGRAITQGLINHQLFVSDWFLNFEGWCSEVVVWKHGEQNLYLRFEQESNDLRILIALGIEGCKPIRTEYPDPDFPSGEWLDQLYLEELRAVYDRLGPESAVDKCRKDGCERGAIELSVYCRVHHFEKWGGVSPCPFDH